MPFRKGDDVFVYNQTFSGKPYLEGRARVLKSTGVQDQYTVRFFSRDDPGPYDRFVYAGECQSDPEGFLRKLQAEAKRGGWMAGEPDDEGKLVESCSRHMASLGL